MATDQGPQLSELRTRLQALGYGTDTATQQNAALNAAQRLIIGLRRWQFQESTITRSLLANVNVLDLSSETTFSDIDAVTILDGTDRLEVTPEDDQTFRHRQWEYQGSTGTPIYWSRYGDTIKLEPKTDKAYTVELDVLLLAADMSADANRTLVPARYADVIVWGAIQWMAIRQRDNATESYAEQQYSKIVRAMLSAYPLGQRQGQTHVQRSGHWTSLGGGTVQWRA